MLFVHFPYLSLSLPFPSISQKRNLKEFRNKFMAVEARHLNLFPSQLLCTREMLNTTMENVNANLHINPAGVGVAPATDSFLPFYNGQMANPPLKDDSGLTFNNSVVLPFSRKRPRETAMVSVPSSADGKVSGRCGTIAGCSSSFSFLGEDLSLQMMQQQLEVDRLILLHMEKVRSEMEERRRKQSRRVVGAIEEAIAKKLRDKEEQIDRIGKLNIALEDRVKSLYLENQIWRDLARTNEATANALRSNLEQVLAQVNNKNHNSGDTIDDAESCCGSSGEGCEEVDGDRILRWRKVAGGERKSISEEEEERRKRMCRRCGAMESSVLVLPCRHLCLCTGCGPTVDTCPICNSTKNASVHVNFS